MASYYWPVLYFQSIIVLHTADSTNKAKVETYSGFSFFFVHTKRPAESSFRMPKRIDYLVPFSVASLHEITGIWKYLAVAFFCRVGLYFLCSKMANIFNNSVFSDNWYKLRNEYFLVTWPVAHSVRLKYFYAATSKCKARHKITS